MRPRRFIDALVTGLVGIEIPITGLTGKWKISQNRSASDRAGVVAGLTAAGDPAGLRMADIVRKTLPPES
jgi:transcriptional regulator